MQTTPWQHPQSCNITRFKAACCASSSLFIQQCVWWFAWSPQRLQTAYTQRCNAFAACPSPQQNLTWRVVVVLQDHLEYNLNRYTPSDVIKMLTYLAACRAPCQDLLTEVGSRRSMPGQQQTAAEIVAATAETTAGPAVH
jgi:hypothetical protein